MAVRLPSARETTTARFRLMVSVSAGILAGLATALWGPAFPAPLVGWDVAATVFIGWSWLTLWNLDAAATRTHALREDPGRAVTDVLLLVASVASVGAVAAVITGANSHVDQVTAAGVGLASVVLSWTLVHTVYTARYARLFYGARHGIEFHEWNSPQYSDFAYLAFTIGMTYQVSDTDLTTKVMRAVVFRHALLSYGLGAVILAATINLVAGLAGSGG